jgi:hypothetical protein
MHAHTRTHARTHTRTHAHTPIPLTGMGKWMSPPLADRAHETVPFLRSGG